MCFQCPYEGGEGVWVQDNPGAPERNGCIVAEGFWETFRVTPRGETLRNQVHPRGGPSEDLHWVSAQLRTCSVTNPWNGTYVMSHPPVAIETQLSGTLAA